MAIKWRLDPPIEDPIPVTNERLVAWGLAVAISTIAVLTALASFDVLPSGDLRYWVIAGLSGSWLSLGRGVYESTLVRMDAEQIRRTHGSDLLVDVVLCTLAGLGCAVLATFSDSWSWLGCALFLTIALDQYFILRRNRAS